MPAVSRRGKGRRTMNEINMVPFIDVMLVLLIIFMVTAPLITPSLINLPSVGAADRTPERFVQVMIDKDARLQVKDGTSTATAQSATLDTLAALVAQLQGPAGPNGEVAVPVVITADKSVRYESVTDAMDRLQRAGVKRVGLAVQTTR